MIDQKKAPDEVDVLIEAIVRKLRQNKDVLARSLPHGGLNWDQVRKGDFKVNLAPRL